jgi:hypothetical protein
MSDYDDDEEIQEEQGTNLGVYKYLIHLFISSKIYF